MTSTLRNPDDIWPDKPMDARAAAWSRYASIPHADINVGWNEYLAELRRIDATPTDRLGKKATKRLLAEVIERDGTACWLCGEQTTAFDRTLEHLEPLSLGGDYDLDNLAVAHIGCNRRMGNLSKAEKLEMRAALALASPDEGES